MHKLKRIVPVMLMVLLSVAVHAQTVTEESTGLMRSNGKIYVVVAVVVTILLGLFLYVFNLDRKISKMEKK